MNKRQRIDQFLARQPYTDGIPAAFFQHFEPTQRHGTAAVEAQLDFYRATDMDMMKIMFDDIYPKFAVKNPEDWRHVPDFSPNDSVFTQQIEVADRLVNAVGKETYVFQTIFSPFVSAGCAVSPIPEWDAIVTPHFREDPEAMTEGLTKIAHTLAEFAKNIAQTGIDGFYVSLQGGEYKRYSEDFFTTWFKPLDIMLLNALKATGKKVLLHICGTGMRLDCYHDYPGDIVNMACVDNNIPIQQILRDFDRAVMGGIPNHGVIVEGTKEQVQEQVRAALSMDTRGVMLGADCTIPKNVSTERLRWAVDVAHAMGKDEKA